MDSGLGFAPCTGCRARSYSQRSRKMMSAIPRAKQISAARIVLLAPATLWKKLTTPEKFQRPRQYFRNRELKSRSGEILVEACSVFSTKQGCNAVGTPRVARPTAPPPVEQSAEASGPSRTLGAIR